MHEAVLAPEYTLKIMSMTLEIRHGTVPHTGSVKGVFMDIEPSSRSFSLVKPFENLCDAWRARGAEARETKAGSWFLVC